MWLESKDLFEFLAHDCPGNDPNQGEEMQSFLPPKEKYAFPGVPWKEGSEKLNIMAAWIGKHYSMILLDKDRMATMKLMHLSRDIIEHDLGLSSPVRRMIVHSAGSK